MSADTNRPEFCTLWIDSFLKTNLPKSGYECCLDFSLSDFSKWATHYLLSYRHSFSFYYSLSFSHLPCARTWQRNRELAASWTITWKKSSAISTSNMRSVWESGQAQSKRIRLVYNIRLRRKRLVLRVCVCALTITILHNYCTIINTNTITAPFFFCHLLQMIPGWFPNGHRHVQGSIVICSTVRS